MMLAEVNWNALFRVENIAIIMGCLIAIVTSVSMAWRSIEKTRSENALKRSLVDRGMGADEIERILAAKGPRE
ncbi:MAG: hypothetical protein DCC65_02775 [Planctomycetota bacterium]|nr:MAG: hypothetical protein DCC65_02775 [Planctomycetota bacterium]